MHLGEPTLELVERQPAAVVVLPHLVGRRRSVGIRDQRVEALGHRWEPKGVSRSAQDKSSRGLVRTKAPRYRLLRLDRPCRCGRRGGAQDEAARSPHQRLRATEAGNEHPARRVQAPCRAPAARGPAGRRRVGARRLFGAARAKQRRQPAHRQPELRRRRLPRRVVERRLDRQHARRRAARAARASPRRPSRSRLEDAGERNAPARPGGALARLDPGGRGGAADRLPLEGTHGRPGRRLPPARPAARQLVDLARRSREPPADRLCPRRQARGRRTDVADRVRGARRPSR